MAQPGRKSPLESFETVPWKGKIHSGVPKTPEQIMRRRQEPSFPVRVASPTTLYFTVPGRAESFEVLIHARGQGNAAAVTIRDPEGKASAQEQGELDAPRTLSVKVARPGVWSVQIAAWEGKPLEDVGLRLENLPTMFSPDAKALLVPPAKKPGLVGYWPMDEGKGSTVADTSQKPAYNGTIRDAAWSEGKLGSCLEFDGKRGRVLIPAEYSYHNLRQFSLSAWVKLTSMPERGNGRTIVNKGPEAPVQHFWWWIGYPPSYPLILEMGSPAHQHGAGFGTGPLEWKLGRWYHVAVVFECDGQKTAATHYRDGELVGSTVRNEAFHCGSHDLKIGTYGGLHWMGGSIDEVKMWDRALTVDEVQAEYRRGADR